MNRAKFRSICSILAIMGLFPLLSYFAFFCLLTYPAITQFRTYFFSDQGDGLQCAWNLWWVRKAVLDLHQSPWHSNYLHWPYGISLLGHTLHPFNGFATMFLPPSIPLVERYNLVVIFSFVVGGLTAFLLAHHVTNSYWASVIAGFLFTFSSFHFAHLEGHLQMVSFEWIPLFILLWFKLVSKPTIPLSICAAIVLFLVILCDFYFFFYCVLAGLIIFCWRLDLEEEGVPFFRACLIPLGVFGLISVATSGLLAGSFLLANSRDAFLGAHPEWEYSLDLFAPFIYGGHWRFASLTKPYWSQLPGSIHESSVHLGLAVVILLVYVWRKRKLEQMPGIGLWFFLLFFFAVLALGPSLQIWGEQKDWLSMPYAWLQALFPPLRTSGVPVRMIIITVLAASVISAEGFKLLFRGSCRNRVFAAVLLGLALLDHLPRPIATSAPSIPPYVSVLRELPGKEGVLDTVSSPTLALYYQTVHEKPLAFGYVSRVPTSVNAKDRELAKAIKANDFLSLWRVYDIKYLITSHEPVGLRNSHGLIWCDGSVWMFDLGACRR